MTLNMLSALKWSVGHFKTEGYLAYELFLR